MRIEQVLKKMIDDAREEYPGVGGFDEFLAAYLAARGVAVESWLDPEECPPEPYEQAITVHILERKGIKMTGYAWSRFEPGENGEFVWKSNAGTKTPPSFYLPMPKNKELEGKTQREAWAQAKRMYSFSPKGRNEPARPKGRKVWYKGCTASQSDETHCVYIAKGKKVVRDDSYDRALTEKELFAVIEKHLTGSFAEH